MLLKVYEDTSQGQGVRPVELSRISGNTSGSGVGVGPDRAEAPVAGAPINVSGSGLGQVEVNTIAAPDGSPSPGRAVSDTADITTEYKIDRPGMFKFKDLGWNGLLPLEPPQSVGVRLPEEIVEFTKFILWELAWRLLVMEAGQAEVNTSSTPCHGSTESSTPRHKGSEGKDNINEKAHKEPHRAVSDDRPNDAIFPCPLEDDDPKENEVKNDVGVGILEKDRLEIEEDVKKEHLDNKDDFKIGIEAVGKTDTEFEERTRRYAPGHRKEAPVSENGEGVAGKGEADDCGSGRLSRGRDKVSNDEDSSLVPVLGERSRVEGDHSPIMSGLLVSDRGEYDWDGNRSGEYNEDELRLIEAYMRLDRDKDVVTYEYPVIKNPCVLTKQVTDEWDGVLAMPLTIELWDLRRVLHRVLRRMMTSPLRLG